MGTRQAIFFSWSLSTGLTIEDLDSGLHGSHGDGELVVASGTPLLVLKAFQGLLEGLVAVPPGQQNLHMGMGISESVYRNGNIRICTWEWEHQDGHPCMDYVDVKGI